LTQNSVVEKHLRTVEILLSGLLLRGADRPAVEKLEKLIGIRKGTLSDLFPQRQVKKSKGSFSSARAGV